MNWPRRRRGLGELPPDHRQPVFRGESRGGSVIGSWEDDGTGAPPPAAGGGAIPFLQYPKVTDAGSKQVLPANANRRYLAVQNKSLAVLTVNFDADASSTTLEVGPAAAVEWFGRVPSNAIHVWAAAAGGAFVVIEG